MANNQGITKINTTYMSARIKDIILYDIVCFLLFCFIDELNTYQQLISMGFEDDISFKAAKKYKNVNEAISFILLDQEGKSAANNNNTTYKDRINKIFNIDTNGDIYDIIINKEYLYNGGINQFIIDHGKYMKDIDLNKEHINYDGLCDFANCLCIKREYRNINIYDNNNIERFKLYNNAKDENGVIIQQLIDQLHFVRYHLIDSGYGINIKEEEKKENITNNVPNKQLRKQIFIKRERFNKITNHKNVTNKSNKFVTEMYMNNNGVVVVDEEHN